MKRSVSTRLITLLMIGGLSFLPGCRTAMQNDPSSTIERSPYCYGDTCVVEEYDGNRGRYEPMRPFTDYSSDSMMGMDRPLEPITGDSSISCGPCSEYTVQKGDTLWAISRRLGVSVNELTSLNGIDKDARLKIGQHLKVPGSASQACSKSTSCSVSSLNCSGEYTVQNGDSLSRIAKRHGTTVAALKQANSLSSDLIRVGQKLKVPSGSCASSYWTSSNSSSTTFSASETGTYTVRSGDTISGIASRFRMKSSELIALNNLSNPNKLNVGQVLVVNGGRATTNNATQATSSTAKKNSIDESLDLFATAVLETDTISDSTSSDAQPESTATTEDIMLIESTDDDALFDNTEEVEVVPVEEDRSSNI